MEDEGCASLIRDMIERERERKRKSFSPKA